VVKKSKLILSVIRRNEVAGKFEVYKDKGGKFRFRLKAGNGQIILTGEAYNSKDACIAGIESVKKNSADPKRFTKTTTPTKMFRFAVTAANSQIIGTSQNYKTESGRDNGIESVKRNAVKAEVKEVEK